jgi:hypothetical protein
VVSTSLGTIGFLPGASVRDCAHCMNVLKSSSIITLKYRSLLEILCLGGDGRSVIVAFKFRDGFSGGFFCLSTKQMFSKHVGRREVLTPTIDSASTFMCCSIFFDADWLSQLRISWKTVTYGVFSAPPLCITVRICSVYLALWTCRHHTTPGRLLKMGSC